MNEITNLKPDDWRRQGQEQYLAGVKLVFKNYFLRSPEWDHDHCEFCWVKFSLYDGDLKKGYSTEDGYYWICEECFNDFRGEFNWFLSTESLDTSPRNE